MDQTSILLGGIMLVLGLIAALYGIRRPAVAVGAFGGLEEVVHKLATELAEARQQIKILEQQNIQLAARITELETLLSKFRKQATLESPVRPPRPLLLVIGDSESGKADETSLLRSKIPFLRLSSCTIQELDDEIRRRRQDNTMYWWIHIAAHMGPEGIQMKDGIISIDWLARRMNNVKVLFLNGCKNVTLADQLAGLVERVVVVYENINNRDAGDFAYAFWTSIASGAEPDMAFTSALRDVPQIASYVDIRKS